MGAGLDEEHHAVFSQLGTLSTTAQWIQVFQKNKTIAEVGQEEIP